MKPPRVVTSAALAAFALAGVGASSGLAGSHERAKTRVAVTLNEWKVIPAMRSAPAGVVTFTVKNRGSIKHEFLVIRSSRPPNALRTKGAEASEAGLTKGTAEFKPGLTTALTVTLKKGTYVLICNIPGHYKAGQYAAFTVK